MLALPVVISKAQRWCTTYFYREDSIEIQYKDNDEMYINMIDMPGR